MFENKYAAATTQLQDLIRAHPQDAKDHATYALVLNYQTKQKPALDEALKNTFPASDPVSVEQPTTTGRARRSGALSIKGAILPE